MSEKSMLVWSLLLKETASQDRVFFTHCTVAADSDEALQETIALANVAAARAGTWEIEKSSVIEIDHDLIVQAAHEILGWEPPPQEITTEQ